MCPPPSLPPPCQVGSNTDRQLVFIDRNRDMYIMSVMKKQLAKLASMVDGAVWHDTTGMLAGMVDQKLVGACHAVGLSQLHTFNT